MPDNELDIYFGDGSAENGGQYDFDSEIANHLKIVSNLHKLKKMRELVIGAIEEKKLVVLGKLRPLIRGWQGQYPDLRKIFRSKEMDWLLTSCMSSQTVLSFVIGSGYKDEPEVDKDGKLLLHRTTALHHANWLPNGSTIIRDLFRIYDRFDANYIDDDGITHLHIACENGFDDIVAKFLDLGQDPNYFVQKSVDPPLHVALDWGRKKVVEVLLVRGANPNLANENGLTPLHIICRKEEDDNGSLAELFFKINDNKSQTVQLDAPDEAGNTPLHSAMELGHSQLIDILLRRGANPNFANEKGSTPLHVICMSEYVEYESMELFFKINKEINQLVQIDARDNKDRTPLQWAVASLASKSVDVLLDHGADLSSFDFPTESHFDEGFLSRWRESVHNFNLRLGSSARDVVERLEKKGYAMDRNDALTLMAFFAKHGFFKNLADLKERWYDEEEFASVAKTMSISPSLSLCDLIRLRPDEATNVIPCKDNFDEVIQSIPWLQFPKGSKEACLVHLCEIVVRKFFRQWALDSFLELTGYRLPILCCEMIIQNITNEDLWRICLAAAGQS